MSKHAILVGVNYLKSNKYRLSSPINDIKLTKDFLVNYCNFHSNNITELSDSPDIKESGSFFNILKHLKKAQELTRDDFLYIYFSGHSSRLGENIYNEEKEENEEEDVETKEDELELFLPQDWEVNKFTNKLFIELLKDIKCRCFILFDCCNSGRICKLKYRFDVKKLEEKNYLKKKDMENNIICISSSSKNKNKFEKFIEKNLININKNKFYGELTIFFLQVVKNYLEVNLSFEELKYENLITLLNEYLTEVESPEKKSVEYKLKHNVLKNTNLLPVVTVSNDIFKKTKFLYNLPDDNDEELKKQNNLNILKRKTVSSLSHKYLRLKRKTDFLERRNNELEQRNNKLLSVISGNVKYNFGLIS